MQGILEQNYIAEALIDRTKGPYGNRIGLIGKLFGCWHKDLSRPFTSKRTTYRACLDCGARREFDTRNFKTSGPFYYPPAVATK